MSTPNYNPVIKSITVQISPEEAFNLFVRKFSLWYPKAYTWSQEKLDTIRIELAEDGRCFERGPLNFEVDWGRVLTYNPPNQIVFTWQIGFDRQPVPDPAQASEVEITFIPEGESKTSIKLEHRHFENYGEDGSAYRDALASPKGWPFILNCFESFVENHLANAE